MEGNVNLVTDIGNTQIKAALYNGGRLTETFTALNNDHETMTEWIRMKEFSRAIICKVGHAPDDIIFTINRLCSNVITLDHFTPVPVKVRYGTPHSLGYDRLAAASGAFSHFPGKDVLIIDAGTAITIDLLTAEGTYPGGNISPGLNTRFRSLNEFTSGLPLVEKDSGYPDFGIDTRTAIAAGVQQGIIYELEGYFRNFLNKHPDGIIAVTGGDAGFLAPLLGKNIFLLPDLVLEGLDRILNYNFGE